MAGSIPRFRDGRPWIVPPGGGKPKRYTRTSKFAHTLDDAYGLALWEQHMVAIGIEKNPWLNKKVREQYCAVTPDNERGYDWEGMNGVVSLAREKAGANAKAEWGTYMHGLTEASDNGGPIDAEFLAPDAEADLNAYDNATESFKHSHIESFCVNDEFEIAGTPDRRTWVEGAVLPTGEIFSGWAISDVKTGSLNEVGFAMQLRAYAESQWYECTHQGEPSKEQCALYESLHTRMPTEVDLDWGILIEVPRYQGVCRLHWIDLQAGRELLELAKKVREMRRVRTISPLFFA
jgi:hypothetical protein